MYNYYVNRRALWSNLVSHASFMRNRPWVLLGDFNAALNLEDHSCGGYAPDIAMREFKQCVLDIEVMDINSTGLHFTWNQKPRGSNGILKKIDRIMGNLKFGDIFPGSFAIFQPYRISDHSPCVLRVPHMMKPKPKPFKFSNFLVYKEGFLDTVTSGWNQNVNGCSMYRVVKRLKGLKSSFRKLLHNQGNLHERVDSLRKELDEVQKAIDIDPFNSALREEHAHYLLAFKEATLDEERFLKQKCKVQWLHADSECLSYTRGKCQVDERVVLKHFDWQEKKADTLREATFAYRDLKKLENEISNYKDNFHIPCDLALKKMVSLSEKMERIVYNLLRTRDLLMRNCKEFHIPTDWMLDSGILNKGFQVKVNL
ncbi:RNA-directed DNA polymerase, eukaryota, Reverse transcriptase zinc-binding domain protein [Artemisia annua]|uniref:RNA-directed DNA polymerase, eukaryota, Reverse transcriptase zinc-binding domain protein n=1 Tax=Artemisia annua TaxID=35608 RepID=A0A2U1MBF0_ARTAN|nr:RNA-directed DNA polymerase, eukaryota, Reverse transcriptase zinc-binding domain protein [Artemisia annua]